MVFFCFLCRPTKTRNRIKGKERLLDKRCGTLPYVAPEILVRPYSATAADVWSCGVILVAMLAGGKRIELKVFFSFILFFRFNLNLNKSHHYFYCNPHKTMFLLSPDPKCTLFVCVFLLSYVKSIILHL